MYEELIGGCLCKTNVSTGVGTNPNHLIVGKRYEVMGVETNHGRTLVTLKNESGSYDASLFQLGLSRHNQHL